MIISALAQCNHVFAQDFITTHQIDFSEEEYSIYNGSVNWSGSTWLEIEGIEIPDLPFTIVNIQLPGKYEATDCSLNVIREMQEENVTLDFSNKAPTTTYYPFEVKILTTVESDGLCYAHLIVSPFAYDVTSKSLQYAQIMEISLTLDEWSVNVFSHVNELVCPKLEDKYYKDWRVVFSSQESLFDVVHAGVVGNATHGEIEYQILECRLNDGQPQTLLYRQDDNKVYRYDETAEDDVLLYDFGSGIGDVFRYADGSEAVVGNVYADVREYADVNYCSASYKTLELRDALSGKVKDVWVEGLGSLYTGILTASDFNIGAEPRVAYCRREGESGMEADFNSWCFIINEPNYKLCYMQPIGASSEDVLTEALQVEFDGDALHLYGTAYINYMSYPLECRISGSKIYLETSDMSFGVVPTGLGYLPVDMTIPDFAEGTYEVLFKPWHSNEVRSLGTVTCGGATGICGSVEGGRATVELIDESIVCRASDGLAVDVFAIDATKVVSGIFSDGVSQVRVPRVPASYIYMITHTDGHHTIGKVMAK